MSTPVRKEEPNWNRIYEFLTITQHETFTAAARAMGVTRPAISKKIRSLESSLGVPLVERAPGSRNFSLTSQGLEVQKLARNFQTALERLQGKATAGDSMSGATGLLEQAEAIQQGVHVLITLLRQQHLAPPKRR